MNNRGGKMKKKILLFLMLTLCFVFVGCGQKSEKEVLKKLTKKIEEAKSYHLEGELEMLSNEDIYKYYVDVSYEENDKFRVGLKNQTNNHEQIILKNEDGVYVLTPSLNKSFKFQSEWPYNNSQSYLLQTILLDIQNDTEKEFLENEDGYVITTKVNYTSNKDLVRQKIYLDKDINIKEVHVLDKENKVATKMKFSKIDLKTTYKKSHFALKENMESAITNEESLPVGKINDVIYPMYMPKNTKLTEQERIPKNGGERIIQTFSGDSSFVLVQETAIKEKEMITVPLVGEPLLLTGTVAAFADTSLSWTKDGVEYYLVSDNLLEDELLTVARSISVIPMSK